MDGQSLNSLGFLYEHIGKLQQVLREGRRPTYEEVVLVIRLTKCEPKLYDYASEDDNEDGLDACLFVEQQLPIITAGFVRSFGIDSTAVLNPGTDDAAAKNATFQLLAASMETAGGDEPANCLPDDGTALDKAMVSATQIAKMAGLSQGAVRERLRRWREKDLFSTDWMEKSDGGSGATKYFYRPSVALDVVRGDRRNRPD